MLEPSPLKHVYEFHKAFKHPILSLPTIPSVERCALRVSLLAEEVEELRRAAADKNVTEVADALCDIQYVLSGAILEFGLGEKFKALFDEVQRSNMSKACKSIDEAEATILHYKKLDGSDAYFEQEGELFLVYRKSDHKVLKSINYSRANLEAIISESPHD